MAGLGQEVVSACTQLYLFGDSILSALRLDKDGKGLAVGCRVDSRLAFRSAQ